MVYMHGIYACTHVNTQVAMAAYQLLGGSRNNPGIMPERVVKSPIPGDKINMFSYKVHACLFYLYVCACVRTQRAVTCACCISMCAHPKPKA